MYKYLFLLFVSLTLLEVKGEDYAITPEDDDMYAPEEDIANQEENEMSLTITEDAPYEEVNVDAVTKQCTCNNKLPASCEDIYQQNPKSKSGEYDIYANGIKIRNYCHMGSLCGAKGGWTRLAYLDMEKGQKCPSGFHLYTSGKVKACGRKPTNLASCQSVTFPSNGVHYSQVCGRVHGYQHATPDAVEPGLWGPKGYLHRHDPKHDDINAAYVDGVSITRGCPRKHVFTFMSGVQENHVVARGRFQCPCNKVTTQKVQSFIGNDYFCESGNPLKNIPRHLFANDKLWDGKQCGSLEKKCCAAKGLPYFNKVIGTTTNNDLELRVCADQATHDEDTPVSFYDIYVK